MLIFYRERGMGKNTGRKPRRMKEGERAERWIIKKLEI